MQSRAGGGLGAGGGSLFWASLFSTYTRYINETIETRLSIKTPTPGISNRKNKYYIYTYI